MKWILGAILIILAIGFAGMLLTEITVIHVTTISDRNYLKISSPLMPNPPQSSIAVQPRPGHSA